MKRIRRFTALLLLLVASVSLPVQAAESIGDSMVITEDEVTPRALITTTNVLKWSEKGYFSVQADIVTNDGTGKIVDIKNIQKRGYSDGMENYSVSSGEIWNGGEYATVTITYQYNGEIGTDIVKYYPYGK